MKVITLALVCLLMGNIVASAEKLVFKTKWGGERIELPPRFAPTLGLKGIEEIRFAPGMFKPESESFFSYVILFAVSEARQQSARRPVQALRRAQPRRQLLRLVRLQRRRRPRAA